MSGTAITSADGLEWLGGSAAFRVERCPNGRLCLRIGAVTLSLTAEQFWDLVVCVGDAAVRLSVREVVDQIGQGLPH